VLVPVHDEEGPMSGMRFGGAGVRVAERTDEGTAATRALRLEDLRVTALSEHGWRITDGRLSMLDQFRVLAFIERREDAFEVMQFGAGIEWCDCASLDDAVRYVFASASRIGRERWFGAASPS
jgi:hypothetical protein